MNGEVSLFFFGKTLMVLALSETRLTLIVDETPSSSLNTTCL
jgi:hypothetical protein